MAEIRVPPKYSKIFERLVTDEGDLIGLIAYALYKQTKRDWIIQYREKHGHQSPSEADEQAFEEAQTDLALARLKSEAEGMLSEYSAYVIEQQTPLIQKQAVQDAVLAEVKQTLDNVRDQGRWWRQVGTSIVGGLGYSIALLVLFLILKYPGSDLLNLIRNALYPN